MSLTGAAIKCYQYEAGQEALMGYANVITGLIAKTLKLLAMVIPLGILAYISIMTVKIMETTLK